MHKFILAPVASGAPEFEFVGLNEAAVLIAADKLGFSESHVYENNAYKFSIRLEAGVWCIFQRP